MPGTLTGGRRRALVVLAAAAMVVVAMVQGVVPAAANNCVYTLSASSTVVNKGTSFNVSVAASGGSCAPTGDRIDFLLSGTAVLNTDYSGPSATSFTVFPTFPYTPTWSALTAPGTRTLTIQISSPNAGNSVAGTPLNISLVDPASAAPVVTSVSPASGGPGQAVVISGQNFTGVSGVAFGTTAATSFTYVNSSTVNAVVPTANVSFVSGNSYHVTVTTGNGTSTATSADLFYFTTGPAVTSISPASGPAGTLVSIAGSGFSAGACPSNVLFGGVVATSCTYNSATSITATAPSGSGSVHVTVQGSATTLQDLFTYTGTPTLTGVSPSSGPLAGNTTITLSGTNLNSPTSITINGQPCTSIFGFGTTATCVTPAGAAAGVPYTVAFTNGAGTASLPAAFTYSSGPTVTGLSPASCPPGGGIPITITGTGFALGATVTFGGVPSPSVTFNSSTSLTATCPIHAAGVVSVIVTVASVSSPDTVNDNFTYTAGVGSLSSITPSAGPLSGGQPVTITGSNLAGVTSVTIGGVGCISPVNVDNQTITCTTGVSATAGTFPVYAVVTAGTATGVNYTYGAGPVVTGFDVNTAPASGTPITYVTVYGSGLSNPISVKFGGTAATIISSSDTAIQVITPAHSAGIVDVIVTTAAGVSPNTAADDFTFTGTLIPSVTSVSPTSGQAGTTVVITGSGFTGASSVTFGGVSASFNVNSDTQITATAPSGMPAGQLDIRVSNSGGTSANVAGDNFTNTASAQTYVHTLYFRWTLVSWNGQDGISISTALSGSGAGTNNVASIVTAIWLFDPVTQTYKGWFPTGAGIPGAVDITTLRKGSVYWIAINASGSTNWTIVLG